MIVDRYDEVLPAPHPSSCDGIPEEEPAPPGHIAVVVRRGTPERHYALTLTLPFAPSADWDVSLNGEEIDDALGMLEQEALQFFWRWWDEHHPAAAAERERWLREQEALQALEDAKPPPF